MSNVDDVLQVEFTRYLTRAQHLQRQQGAVAIEACLSPEDLATMQRTAGILAFAATLLQSWGAPQEEVEPITSAAGVVAHLRREWERPEVNWAGED